VVWPFGYDLCCPRRSALNTVLTFGFHKTWGISWYLPDYVLLKNEFQSASSLDAINRESQHAGLSYTFVYICVIIIVLFYICKEHIISIQILYQKAYTLTLNPLTWKIWWAPNNASRRQVGFNSAFKGLNLSDIISALRYVTVFVIAELLYAFHTSM
jgi:hypothetical protein